MPAATFDSVTQPVPNNVPSLDLKSFTEGTESQRKQFTDLLLQSLLSTGFVKLRNHDVPDQVVEDSFNWSKRFYDLDTEAKLKTKNLPGPNPQRGWSSFGDETTGQLNKKNGGQPAQELHDAKEHYDIGATDDMQFPNKWPDEEKLQGFRSFMEDYYVQLQAASIQIMRALEVGLELPAGTLEERCEAGASELRLNRYPAVDVKKLTKGDTARIWPHTDFGIITLLFQDGAGGLEIQNRTKADSWIPVAPSSDKEMVVNISDTFERWTNGVLKAGLHRVSVPPGKTEDEKGFLRERWSIAFFLKARREISAGPLPQFVTADRPAAYDDITALQYQQQRTSLVY